MNEYEQRKLDELRRQTAILEQTKRKPNSAQSCGQGCCILFLLFFALCFIGFNCAVGSGG